MPMSWDRLVAFAQAEAPAFLSSVKGVSPADIERVESECQVRLPENYRRFLMLMGEDSAGFQLFGRTQNHRLADVLAQRTEDDSYPLQEFFPISYSADNSMATRIDHFLDLSGSDGVDAPIVMFNG